MDQSKKTMRHFYCRDVLWETFEQMANDFDCSIDYLVNRGDALLRALEELPVAGRSADDEWRPVANNASGPTAYPKGAGPGAGSGGPTRNRVVRSRRRKPSASAGPAPRRQAPPTPGYAPGAAAASVGRAPRRCSNGPG